MLRIESTADLDTLRDQKRAVVLLYVDWAIHARHSATIAERMILAWNRNHRSTEVDLLQIDLSEQSGEMWDAVAEWLESQNIREHGALMYGGVGAIIWVRWGTILQYVVNAALETLGGLLAITAQSFDTSDMTDAK